jgi:cell wall-associated NlpC family hydrolase
MIRLIYFIFALSVITAVADDPVTVVKLSDWRIKQIGKANPVLKPLLDKAKPFIGVPYKWGGTHIEKEIDCSNFTWQLFRSVGNSYERFLSTRTLAVLKERDGLRKVSSAASRPGDLLVYGYRDGKKWHGHVVILIDKQGKISGHKGLVLGAHGGKVNAVQFVTFRGYEKGYFRNPKMKLRNVLRVGESNIANQ